MMAISILKPVIEWGATLVGHPVVLPLVDTATTGSMLMALLGLGAMHMNENVQQGKQK